MLTRSLLGWNSNRIVRRPVRSYSVRSALATKSSAASSLFNFGSFFFIILDLLRVHVTGADRANERFVDTLPQREHDQNVPPLAGPADRLEPRFAARVSGIGKYRDRPLKHRFDCCSRDAVLPVFPAVRLIPIKSGNQWVHPLKCAFVHPIVNTNGMVSGVSPIPITLRLPPIRPAAGSSLRY